MQICKGHDHSRDVGSNITNAPAVLDAKGGQPAQEEDL